MLWGFCKCSPPWPVRAASAAHDYESADCVSSGDGTAVTLLAGLYSVRQDCALMPPDRTLGKVRRVLGFSRLAFEDLPLPIQDCDATN